jgi:hypothetical protein
MKNTFKIHEIRYMSKGGGMIRELDEERRENGGGKEIAQEAEEGRGLENMWEGAWKDDAEMIPAGIHCIRGEKRRGMINGRKNSPYLVEEMMGDGHHRPVKLVPSK